MGTGLRFDYRADKTTSEVVCWFFFLAFFFFKRGGSYVVEGTFLPLVAIADAAPKTRRGAKARGGGTFGGLEKVVAVQMKVVAPKPPDRRKKSSLTGPAL